MNNAKLSSIGKKIYFDTIDEHSKYIDSFGKIVFKVLDSYKNEIGIIGLSDINSINQSANLNIYIKNYIEMNSYIVYVRDSINTMIDYAHNHLNLNSIIMTIPTDSIKFIYAVLYSNLMYLGSKKRGYKLKYGGYCDELYFGTTKREVKMNDDDIENNRIQLMNSRVKFNKEIDLNQTRYNDETIEKSNIIENGDLTLISGKEYKCSELELKMINANLNDSSVSLYLNKHYIDWNFDNIEHFLESSDYIILNKNSMVGFISSEVCNSNRNLNLEMLILLEQRNKGYGKKALNMYIEELYTKRGIINLTASIFSFDEVGLKLMKSSGFDQIVNKKEICYSNGKFYDSIVFNKHNDNIQGIERLLFKIK